MEDKALDGGEVVGEGAVGSFELPDIRSFVEPDLLEASRFFSFSVCLVFNKSRVRRCWW